MTTPKTEAERIERKIALAEGYAAEYCDARKHLIDGEKHEAWKGVRAGYLQAIEDANPLPHPDTVRLETANREIEFLRRYGNKDCTAMADASMEQEKK